MNYTLENKKRKLIEEENAELERVLRPKLVKKDMGTMEEWTLRNWSVLQPAKYIGHPFHIHINDYQTKKENS